MKQLHEFAHFILPEEVWLDTLAAWESLSDPRRAPAQLRAWWTQAHAYSGTLAAPLPADGLAVAPVTVADGPALLITLPEASGVGTPLLALFVLGELGAARYFLLEHAHDGATTLGERLPDTASHKTWGAGPATDTPELAEAFRAAVEELLRAGGRKPGPRPTFRRS